MNVLSFGGGTDSTAIIGGWWERGFRPDYIIFADTGGERPHTYAHIERMQVWLAAHGFPPITIVRKTNRAQEIMTLEQNCLEAHMLPSLAYGFKSCSQKFKVQPQEKFVNRLPGMRAFFKAGGKVDKYIGYEFSEQRRWAKAPIEDGKYRYHYPLVEWEWSRPECLEAIRRMGLPLPGKSSCFFCPASTKPEIAAMHKEYPLLFQRAIAIENNAILKTIKGLGRRFSWKDYATTLEEPTVVPCMVCIDEEPIKEPKMKHSTIVGGSTAKRVINCPGSVALCAKMPPKPSSSYADEGTLLHNVISDILNNDKPNHEYLGVTYEAQELTAELMDEKLLPALECLDVIDPDKAMEFATDANVDFGKFLPGVFGSADLVGRIGNKAIVLDWKFGSGVPVSAEENEQLMFYAAAAMRTKETQWVFDGATEIELIIVQIDKATRWTTTPARIAKFEKQLKSAVKASRQIDAKLQHGDHCRWCAAKPICPLMTGAVDRALQTQIEGLDKPAISAYLKNADVLEEWIKDLRALAMQVMESGATIPGWKLVAKRSVRKWTDEKEAAAALQRMGVDPYKQDVVSPAQAEKLLKPWKKELPTELIASVSSGNTFAEESDPRPAIVQIGTQLTAALSKIV